MERRLGNGLEERRQRLVLGARVHALEHVLPGQGTHFRQHDQPCRATRVEAERYLQAMPQGFPQGHVQVVVRAVPRQVLRGGGMDQKRALRKGVEADVRRTNVRSTPSRYSLSVPSRRTFHKRPARSLRRARSPVVRPAMLERARDRALAHRGAVSAPASSTTGTHEMRRCAKMSRTLMSGVSIRAVARLWNVPMPMSEIDLRSSAGRP